MFNEDFCELMAIALRNAFGKYPIDKNVYDMFVDDLSMLWGSIWKESEHYDLSEEQKKMRKIAVEMWSSMKDYKPKTNMHL